MSQFRVGDWVYGSDWCFGQIVHINEDNTADVEFESCGGGGTACFAFDDLVLANDGDKKALCTRDNSNV